jgi:hypothetical protein
VILHRLDGRFVERLIQTTTDGTADFGDTGRQRATITLSVFDFEIREAFVNRQALIIVSANECRGAATA